MNKKDKALKTDHQARLAKDLMRISDEAARHLTQPGPSTGHAEWLYDEMGLPR